MEPKHTPTPWKTNEASVEGRADGYAIWINDNDHVGEASTFEDADFIVRAVNCHEDLMAALKLADAELVRMSRVLFEATGTFADARNEVLVAVRRAILKAETQ